MLRADRKYRDEEECENLRRRVIAWAAGVWQKLHIVKMMARRDALRLNPKMINMPLPLLAASPSSTR